MAGTPSQTLSPLSGEFLAPDQEAAFQAERLPETLRHVRLIFLASALLNTLFFINDWRFYGEPHFAMTAPARLVVVLIALACFLTIRHATHFRQAQRFMIAWEWVTGAAVAVLVSARSDIALLIVLMLPSIYYLAVPTAFRWSVLSGAGCSLTILAGYLLPDHPNGMSVGLLLAMLLLNCALVLVLARGNRLQRVEWSATQAERRAKEELADSRAMFETMFKMVPIPLVVLRQDGTIAEHNDAAVRYFGATPETLGIQKVGEVYVDLNDRDAFVAMLARDGQVSNFETQIRLADGSVRTVLAAGRALEIGGTGHIMAGIVDITDRKAAEERIWRAASHDPLTNLPNRAFFQSRLEQALAHAERNGSRVTLLLLDLDHLGAVNDTLGHEAGDALIREAASRLSLLAGKGDAVARLGGDEFVIIVADAPDLSHARTLAEELLADLRRPFGYGDKVLCIEASIGVACYPYHDRQPSDLMKDADLALQAAKAGGRNRAVLYAPWMRHRVEQKATAARDIQEALRQRQIVPYYQPKIDLATGRVRGFEALARWRHPVHGLLMPGAFPAAFDDPELSVAFGEHMIERIAEDMRTWLDQGVDFGHIAVNLSTAQFSWVGLARRCVEILHAAKVPTRCLEVEITETVFLGRSAPHVVKALEQFRDSGISIALDDFGTGYASLIHLKQFPIDSIKIDQSFVRDLENDADSAAIVRAIIKLGTSLGMNVVAEGVERAEQAAFLWNNGCAQAQGYLYARPMSANQVPQFTYGLEAECA